MRAFSGSLAEMFFRRHKAGRPSPEEAMGERLLAGRGAGPGARSGHHALERVLAAAAGPATQRELSGEVAAVAAFLLAAGPNGSRARHRRPTRRPMSRRPAYKLPAVTAALVMVMVLAIGGTAAAGALPGPLQQLAHTTFGAPAPVGTGRPPAVGNPRDGQGTSGPATIGARPAATPGGTQSTAPAAGDGNAQGQQEPKSASTAASSTTKSGGGQGDGNGQGNGNNQGGGTGHGKGPGQGARPTPSPPPTPASPTGAVRLGKTDGQG